MPESKADAWIQISSGGTTSVFLAFDSDLTSRSEATFRDLVRMFPAPLTVLQATQPPGSFSAALPAGRYLDWWREGIACVDARIGAILGYCAGSVFASAMADELEVRQGARPAVVLFNPGKPALATLDRDSDHISYLGAARRLDCGAAWAAAIALNSAEGDADVNLPGL
jgi:hypothetical protein